MRRIKKKGASENQNLRINSGESSLILSPRLLSQRAQNAICRSRRLVITCKEVYPFLINLEFQKFTRCTSFYLSFSSAILYTHRLIFKISFATR